MLSARGKCEASGGGSERGKVEQVTKVKAESSIKRWACLSSSMALTELSFSATACVVALPVSLSFRKFAIPSETNQVPFRMGKKTYLLDSDPAKKCGNTGWGSSIPTVLCSNAMSVHGWTLTERLSMWATLRKEKPNLVPGGLRAGLDRLWAIPGDGSWPILEFLHIMATIKIQQMSQWILLSGYDDEEEAGRGDALQSY